MKQINSIFCYTQTEFWFDGQGENYKSLKIFEDGRISTYDFEDERIPSEIEKEWNANEKLTEAIKQILQRITGVLEDYDNDDYDYDYVSSTESSLCKIANLIEESFCFDSFNKEISFYYKKNNISSEYYKKKAPFTLLVKQIQERIKLEYPDFEMIEV